MGVASLLKRWDKIVERSAKVVEYKGGMGTTAFRNLIHDATATRRKLAAYGVDISKLPKLKSK